MNIEIGTYVVKKLEQTLKQKGITEETKGGLRECFNGIADAVEQACPAALFVKPMGGLGQAYGPGGIRDGEMLVCVATSKTAFVFPIVKTEMVEFTEEAKRRLAEHGFLDAPRSAMWYALGRAIEGDRCGQ